MIIIETCPKCGHDLLDITLTSYPPIPQKLCPQCGWGWTGEPEKIIRVPFGGNSYISSDLNYKLSPCMNCSNNSKNGGSGVCNCTL